MKIYNDISEVGAIHNPVLTTGTFDGVHLGHKKLIHQLKQKALGVNGETALLTFQPHPRMVLFPNEPPIKLINTLEEKKALLQSAGIDHLIVQKFNTAFANLSSTDFIKNILVDAVKVKCLVIGYNHRFGKDRAGSFEHLKEFGPLHGFDVEEIAAHDVDNIEISSTRIRKAIESGDIITANSYLGYNYFFTGNVIKGKQLGRTLGYPTANLQIEDANKLIPADGIYAVEVVYNEKRHKGMMSIGLNPTVDGTKRTIEVNIFDFDQTIYGETLRVNFFEKLRNEAKFNSLEDLKNQMHQDKIRTLSILTK